jgi:hypothetical protein
MTTDKSSVNLSVEKMRNSTKALYNVGPVSSNEGTGPDVTSTGKLLWISGECQKRGSFVYVLCCISLIGRFPRGESSVDWEDPKNSVEFL